MVGCSSTGAARALDALGDAHRRQICELLAERPRPVHELAEHLPISRPAVSRHLRLLAGAGLVDARAEGTSRIYSLRAEGAAAVRAYFEQLWGDAAARFRLAAENLDPPGAASAPDRARSGRSGAGGGGGGGGATSGSGARSGA